MKNYKFHLSVIAAAVVGVSGCLSGGGGSDSSTTTSGGSINGSSVFPSGLAVTSPTARSTTSSARMIAAAEVSPSETSAVSGSHYQQATKIISELLAGTADVKLSLDPKNFFEMATNANCYGPTLKFTNHPNGSSTQTEMPSGDLGIWKELEGEQACAAAELNSRMKGVSSRTLMGLMGLASMIAVANKSGLTLPTAGTSLDLKPYLTALGLTKVTFNTATLALDLTGKVWSYTLAISAKDMNDTAHDVSLALTHAPGTSETAYEGLFNYRVSGQFGGNNCNSGGPGPMVVSNESTMNGTLYYKRSANQVIVNSREGGYCGAGTVAATGFDIGVDATSSYKLLDPSVTYHATNSPLGWADNFSILSGKFDPSTLEGDYVYAWQAGKGDSHSRTFQMHVAANAATGDAYFGFGQPVGTSDGTIDGMICNWAGPGNSHTPVPYAQHQPIKFDATVKGFIVGTAGSEITFAPTNTCIYDGSGLFWYDRNLDGANTSADKVNVQTVLTGSDLVMNLLGMGGKSSVQANINTSGFVLPPF